MRRFAWFAWPLVLCGVSVMGLGCGSGGNAPVSAPAGKESLDVEGRAEDDAFKTGMPVEAPSPEAEEEAVGSPPGTSEEQEFKTGSKAANE